MPSGAREDLARLMRAPEIATTFGVGGLPAGWTKLHIITCIANCKIVNMAVKVMITTGSAFP